MNDELEELLTNAFLENFDMDKLTKFYVGDVFVNNVGEIYKIVHVEKYKNFPTVYYMEQRLTPHSYCEIAMTEVMLLERIGLGIFKLKEYE